MSTFYDDCNSWWLDDPANTIPDEYSSWGSFIQLHDLSLRTQVTLCEEMAAAEAPSEDGRKVGLIWKASMARFADWDAGKGDLSAITSELEVLAGSLSQESPAAWNEGLAKYCVRCVLSGVSIPFDFDKVPNLDDSENVVLELGGSGTSLPTRDYYTDDKFAEQRKGFLAHLGKIGTMFGFEEDFAERVMRFETKLAQISMTPGQSRQYDQFYSVTTLDGLIEDINSLKHLADKAENYKSNVVPEGDADTTLLTSPEWSVDEASQGALRSFLTTFYTELGLREALSKNYKQHYTDKGVAPKDPESAEFRMVMFDGDYFRRIFSLLLAEHNYGDVVAYMKYKVVNWGSGYCTKELDEEVFDFFGRQLGGQKEQKSAQKRTVGAVNSWVGELLGKVYVDRFFSSEDKDNVRAMIGTVVQIMENSLQNNDWLTADTKAKAALKLAKFVTKIGYPDKWTDFSELDGLAEGDSLLGIRRKVAQFKAKTEFFDKINTPKDKTKWEMDPHVVNAYFHPLNNEIVFPAAILQPPFYTKDIKDVQFSLGEHKPDDYTLLAVNYGGIGAVIAHEITHGYDDQGRKFDDCGNIMDWWQKEDAELFKVKCDLMKKQAETYTYVDTESNETHTMNGELTMGENLADLGGMSLAVQALEKRLAGVEGAAPLAEYQQIFFKSWANVWKQKQSNADAVKKLASDPHAPTPFRANLVKNVDAYYTAFDVKEGHTMYIPPEERVQMW